MATPNTTIITTELSASPTSLDPTSLTPSVDTTTLISTLTSDSTSSPTPESTSLTPTSDTSVISTTFTPPPTSTVIETQSSVPPTTIVSTSVVTLTPSSGTPTPTVVVSTFTPPPASSTTSTSSDAPTTTSLPPALSNEGSNGSGGSSISTGGITAIAVVVPVVVVALLVVLGLFLWRKRKQKKAAEEMRRKEVEDYGFNPNNDPTLPAVASESGHEMSEDHSGGYRGWGAATASNRKMSTTLSGGHTQGQLSDSGSNAYQGAHSPNGGNSDAPSGDPLMDQRGETMSSDDVGSLGQGPIAGAGAAQAGMRRGPSNASSTYSAANRSDVSDGPPVPGGAFDAYQPHNGYGYSQHGPYGDSSYGGTQDAGMPVVRDVSARRNTRIQQPGNYQQGNSGISQNF